MFVNFLKQASALNKNLVFIAHDKEDKQGDSLFIRPEIGGSSSGDLIKELDLVGYMEAVGKNRTISFDPCDKFYGKNTCQLDSLIQVPVLTTSKNDFLTNIINKYKENQANRVVMVQEYESLLKLIKSNAEECKTLKECNEYLDWVNSLTNIWDSKIQAGVLINKKARELGFTFNKLTKYFEGEVKETKKATSKVQEELNV